MTFTARELEELELSAERAVISKLMRSADMEHALASLYGEDDKTRDIEIVIAWLQGELDRRQP